MTIGSWWKLNNEPHNLYSSRNNSMENKSREMRRIRACSTHGVDRKFSQFWSENIEGKGRLEDQRADKNVAEIEYY
jgi:hypothetical protein